MKTFVLIVSKTFPKTHKEVGKSTGFVENIENLFTYNNTKIHTIRSNYHLWEKRAMEINSGQAILSIRYWSDKPYKSKQVEIIRLGRIGIQKLINPDNFISANIGGSFIEWGEVARNDGLSFENFCDWFKVRQKEPMAIIHFTNFRY